MSRLVIANLLCESEWAQAPVPARRVRVLLSQASLQLAVFCEPGDRLWTVEPEPGNTEAGVELVSGPLSALSPAPTRILAWGETESVASLRTELAQPEGITTWREGLWSLHTTPAIAREANHKRFAYELAGQLGVRLPGATVIRSVTELQTQLATGSSTEQWIVKAPLAAAGRERLRRRGNNLDPEGAVRVERLLELYGVLIYEPWMERIDDFGCCGVVTPDGALLLEPHRIVNNSSGVFQRVEPLTNAPPTDLRATAEAAGQALADRGYRGPFGVDSYTYRTTDNRQAFHPMSEINARLTFGHVFHASR